jgi:hypothetical protein
MMLWFDFLVSTSTRRLLPCLLLPALPLPALSASNQNPPASTTGVASLARSLARRSLKPQLNQIRTWVRQGRTDAWIAHQLEVSVRDIGQFKREHELASADAPEGDVPGPVVEEEPDLRAEDDALVAAALEAEQEEDQPASEEDDGGREPSDEGDDDGDDRPKRRRRGRRGGRGRGRGRARKPLEGTFDHGEEGYGLWLDPAVQDDPVYAEHWAGHRPVTVSVETDRIVITRTGEESSEDDSGSDD